MFQEIKEWWEDFSFYKTFRLYWWRNGYRRMKRFMVWFPIIWADEDWDEAYLFEIMRFKISQIRKETQRCARHLNWERDVRNMKIAEELLNRQAFSNFYWNNEEKISAELCNCKKNPTYEDRFRDNGDGTSTWIWKPCSYCKATRKRMPTKEKGDFEFLLKHFKKHVKEWWN